MKLTAIFLALSLFVFAAFGQKAAQPKKAAPAKPQPQKTTKTAAAKPGKTRPKTAAKVSTKSTPKTSKPAAKTPPKATAKAPQKKLAAAKPVAAVQKRDEKAEFEAAASAEPLERVNALKKFVVDFPQSQRVSKARELLVAARATVADEKLRSGDAEASVALFKLAIEEAPEPMPEKLFTEVVSRLPYNLYFNGQRAAAIEIASAI